MAWRDDTGLMPVPWVRRFPRRDLVAMIAAAIAPNPTAVRTEGFGSHFIALSTTAGGSLACGAE